MTAKNSAAVAAPEARRVRVRLSDLGLAPENLRAEEAEDEGVARLAETIRAAGLIYPPIVRPGRRGEPPFMVLDGRRRRFALLRLVKAGQLSPEHEVECILAVGRAAQAAAAVLPNAEHAPVHLADVILAIGKLRKARMDTAAIAQALGYDELEIRRLEAFARLDPLVLDAFRAGRLTLRQLRLFARLKDRRRQAELAQTALDGYFHDYQLQSLVQGGRVTVEDARFALVAPDAYVTAGGRLRDDLFGELATEVLDPDRLEDLWRTRATGIAVGLTGQGLALYLARDRGYRAPDGLASLPFVHWGSLTDDQREAFDAVRGRIEAATEAVGAAVVGPDRDAALAEMLDARLALARLSAGAGEVKAVLLAPASDGVDAVFYHLPAEAAAADDTEDEDGEADDEWETPPGASPDLDAPEMEVSTDGLSHVQHAAHTDLATRGLIRDLADMPEAALVVLTAQLFKQLVLATDRSAEASALAVRATAYRPGGEPIAGLEADVSGRLAGRRDAYRASGLRPIAYVAGLEPGDRLALLAELTASALDLHEPRTTSVRRSARAEAAEIAALCQADLAARWTPDAGFLAVHSKPQLLGFLAEMGAEASTHRSLKKDELVQAVAAAAAERGWVPAALRWSAAASPAAEAEDALEPVQDEVAA
jgi:ParB family chromosome partitioning protein